VARLFADENFPFPVVEALRRVGHDVVTVADAGKARQALTDEEVLELATADQRAVVTLNRKHFVRLHRTDRGHAGIIVCSLDLDFDGQATRINQAIETQESLVGSLIRVNRPRDGAGLPATTSRQGQAARPAEVHAEGGTRSAE
jgi:hypothetical protein